MFESQRREDIEALMKTDTEFRRLYRYHHELDSKVHDVAIGVLPMDDTALTRMKREKLLTKKRLQRMWADRKHFIC